MAEGQNLRYAELTCTPYTSVLRGIPIEAYTEAIEDARVAAERDFGLVLHWIYDIPGESGSRRPTRRWSTPSSTAPTRSSASAWAGRRSACRGHSSSRTSTPRVPPGLRSVPHAGETTGPETVWDVGAAARRRAHRPRLLGRRRTPSCWPTSPRPAWCSRSARPSNIATRAVDRIEDHPLRAFVEAGSR